LDAKKKLADLSLDVKKFENKIAREVDALHKVAVDFSSCRNNLKSNKLWFDCPVRLGQGPEKTNSSDCTWPIHI
jgi:hypothetical protein